MITILSCKRSLLLFTIGFFINLQGLTMSTWKSIVTSEMLTEKTVRFCELQIIDGKVYIIEGRPEEKGRRVIVDVFSGKDLINDPHTAKNGVHEYGGDTLCGDSQCLYFTGKNSQICKLENGSIENITSNKKIRYAEPTITKDYLFAVFEDHTDEKHVVNGIVSICRKTHQIISKTSSHDFYAGVKVSPDEKTIAFFTWDIPNMSWDEADVHKGIIEEGQIKDITLVSPEGDISSCDPSFDEDGNLYYISDESGYWNIYNEQKAPVLSYEADFTSPHWHLGNVHYTFLENNQIACVFTKNATDYLGIIRDGKLEVIDLEFTCYTSLKSIRNTLYFIAASKIKGLGVYSYDLSTNELTLLKSSHGQLLPEEWISTPQEIAFPTRHGETSYGFYYPPKNPNVDATEKPPLLLISHGGPTGHNPPIFRLGIQYWTSRGFGVIDVNYSGSTGFGRAYRNRLYGNWGVKDVDDCEDAALYLVEKGLVDKDKLTVRGGSAGGYTTLALLTFRDTFCAGASYFGVSDLFLLAKDTHKFESRYLDKLIAPYPDGKEIYDERSPICHTDKMRKPILILQGDEDKVVPVNQAEKMYEALLEKDVPTAYILFNGEGHGFVKKDNIIKSIESELYFYERIFGLEPSFATAPVIIENL